MPFSLLDLEKNCSVTSDIRHLRTLIYFLTYDGMNFTHLTWLMFLYVHHLVKDEIPKMHVNTNLAFNIMYKIAIKCIDSFIKCSFEPRNTNEQ